MTRLSGRLSQITGQLGFRLALSVALALVPVAAVVRIQSETVLTEARARSEAALQGETLRAAASQIVLINRAQGAARAVAAAVAAIRPDRAACAETLAGLAGNIFTYAGLYAPDGRLVCASRDSPPAGVEVPDETDAGLSLRSGDGADGNWMIDARQPVTGADGQYEGYVVVSVAHRGLLLSETDGSLSPLALITFDERGRILSATGGVDAADRFLPAGRDLAELASTRGATFSGRNAAGDWRSFSVTPIIAGRLFALGTWPTTVVDARFGVPPLLLAALLTLAGLAASWVAAEWLVVRHIRQLRDAMRSFATGGRVVGELDFATAPAELRDVADSYELMTDTILHDEAELEDMVHQKEVLLREVHHRVKNNLQLIASIMNMQIRQAKTEEAREEMRALQDRVMSLATIHRALYQTSGLTDIRADELLPDIVAQILAGGARGVNRLRVTTHFDDIRLTPDQAVPLALLLTEALSNAVVHATADGEPSLEVRFDREGDTRAQLLVRNSASTGLADGAAASRSGLGTSLTNAFARQLDGTLDIRRDGGSYALALKFALTPLSQAEQRRQAVAANGGA